MRWWESMRPPEGERARRARGQEADHRNAGGSQVVFCQLFLFLFSARPTCQETAEANLPRLSFLTHFHEPM
jgi:hypothetical protein